MKADMKTLPWLLLKPKDIRIPANIYVQDAQHQHLVATVFDHDVAQVIVEQHNAALRAPAMDPDADPVAQEATHAAIVTGLEQFGLGAGDARLAASYVSRSITGSPKCLPSREYYAHLNMPSGAGKAVTSQGEDWPEEGG